jgi:hypothetical protein
MALKSKGYKLCTAGRRIIRGSMAMTRAREIGGTDVDVIASARGR